eukprot:SAG22_NODE_25773_length_100_cov_854.000000_1_plen_20_part_10
MAKSLGQIHTVNKGAIPANS